MKRLIVLLLMFLLPLQIVWASVDTALPVAAQQVHHSHEFIDGASDDGAQLVTASADDPDCDYCHHSVFSMLFLSFHFDCLSTRQVPPGAACAPYDSFIGQLRHPPDIAVHR